MNNVSLVPFNKYNNIANIPKDRPEDIGHGFVTKAIAQSVEMGDEMDIDPKEVDDVEAYLNNKKKPKEKKAKLLKFDEYNVVQENIQLADKLYFNSNVLSETDKKFILDITHGDNTTKLMCDIYLQVSKTATSLSIPKTITNSLGFWSIYLRNFKDIHEQIKTYNKNYFPIEGYDILNTNKNLTYGLFMNRGEIITLMKKLPSVAIRNLQRDIRKPRTQAQFQKYKEDLEYFMDFFTMMSNRSEKDLKMIYNKLFKSDTTLSDMIQFAEDKANLIGGVKITKKYILSLIKEHGGLELVYNEKNIMVIKVTDSESMKAIGCNSVWCFTYGSPRIYTNNSYDNICYVIVDLNKNSDDSGFMKVLVRPIDFETPTDDEELEELFDMSNNQIVYAAKDILRVIPIDKAEKIFDFI